MKRTTSQTEKKMVYSIRSLKNGTGSVLIGASLVLLAMATPTISAKENTTTTNESNSETTTALPPNLLLMQQTSLARTKAIFLHLIMQNASLETKEEKPATKPTTPVASPTDSEPQTRQDRSSESTTSTSPVTLKLKAERAHRRQLLPYPCQKTS